MSVNVNVDLDYNRKSIFSTFADWIDLIGEKTDFQKNYPVHLDNLDLNKMTATFEHEGITYIVIDIERINEENDHIICGINNENEIMAFRVNGLQHKSVSNLTIDDAKIEMSVTFECNHK